MKRQTSAKVKILTVIIMIVGSFYWLFGKLEVWIGTRRQNKIEKKQKQLLVSTEEQNEA